MDKYGAGWSWRLLFCLHYIVYCDSISVEYRWICGALRKQQYANGELKGKQVQDLCELVTVSREPGVNSLENESLGNREG